MLSMILLKETLERRQGFVHLIVKGDMEMLAIRIVITGQLKLVHLLHQAKNIIHHHRVQMASEIADDIVGC